MTLLLALLINLSLAALAALVPALRGRRRLLGGFLGALAVAFVGSVAGGFAFDWALCRIADGVSYLMAAVNWLMKNSDARVLPPVNVLASALGAVLLLWVFHRISPRD